MRIVVTGGAGYIGSVCVELLCDSGHDVLVIDNLGEGHRGAVDPRAGLEVLDLRETARLTDVLRGHETEAVIHYAANALVGESMENPAKYYRNNVMGGLSLLEAMVAAEVGAAEEAPSLRRVSPLSGFWLSSVDFYWWPDSGGGSG